MGLCMRSEKTCEDSEDLKFEALAWRMLTVASSEQAASSGNFPGWNLSQRPGVDSKMQPSQLPPKGAAQRTALSWYCRVLRSRTKS